MKTALALFALEARNGTFMRQTGFIIIVWPRVDSRTEQLFRGFRVQVVEFTCYGIELGV